MNKIILILALVLTFNTMGTAQSPNIDTEKLEEELEMMQRQMSKLFEQLNAGMEDGKFFFIDTTFTQKYKDLELDDLNEDGELSPQEFGQSFEMLSKMMMQDLLKMAEGIEDLPFFQDIQPVVPAPEEDEKGSQKGKQSDKMKKKRIVKTL